MSTVVKDLGAVSAYAYAVEKGYTGTEAEFAELMASYADVGQTAVDAKDAAVAAKTAAQTAATTATNKASEATTAATTATNKAAEAQADADAAALDASQALSAASTATTKATEATAAAGTATTAKNDAVSAKTAAETAQGKAEDAQAAAEAVAESIPSDYSQLSEDVTELKSGFSDKAPVIVETASGSIASFTDGSDMPMKSLVVNIEPVQSGSGDPSPTNIRPISGWMGATVKYWGKNLADAQFGHQVPSVANGQMASANGWSTDYIAVDNSKDYVFSYSGSSTAYVLFYGADYSYLGYKQISTGVHVQKLSEVSYYSSASYIKLRSDSTQNIDPLIQIEEGSTATPYEPHGTTYSVDWQSEAGTVYGGTIDVVSGELVVDRAMVDLGTLSWGYRDVSGHERFVSPALSPTAKIVDNSTVANIRCSQYKSDTSNHVYTHYAEYIISIDGDGAIQVYDSRYTDSATFKTAMSGVKLVYELATTQTYQLSPTEVKSLLGQNHVLADTGDADVEYRADTKLYIEKLTAPTEDDMVADHAISAGTFFMIGNTLYLATSQIAAGGTITPGTNATRLSLADALNQLNT